MWLQQRLKGLPGLLSSSWARRLLLGLLLFLVFFWYLGGGAPRRWRPFGGGGGLARLGGAAAQCLQAETQRWAALEGRGEAVGRGPGEPPDTPFITGNGHLLVDADANRLWVAAGAAPALQTEFPARVSVRLEAGRADTRRADFGRADTRRADFGRAEAGAALLWFRRGSVLSARCWAAQNGGDCVSVREELLAHRRRPNLLLQRLHLRNPGELALTLSLTQTPPGRFPSSVEAVEEREVLLTSVRVPVETGGRLVLMVVASRKLSARIQVAPKSEYTDTLVSVVWSSEPVEPAQVEETFSALREGARKELGEVLRIPVDELLMDHQQAWADLFISGVEMMKITDSHTPSGRTVNTTLFYVLACSPAPLLDRRLGGEERARLESSLSYADHCFSGHATMHAQNLWAGGLGAAGGAGGGAPGAGPAPPPRSARVLQLVTLWTLTLQKRGCRGLLAAGAHGALQAMLLSFGGLQFTENHLQFQADPDVLHNGYALRGLRYRRRLLRLAVARRRGGGGSPVLQLSLGPQGAPLFACEAGCLREPVRLEAGAAHTFPVMVTQPITPLLYISTELQHLQELRHTLHLRAILPHQEHMAARDPGLPFLFWFSVASLITLFHLFLFKLIYNEYCGPGAKPLFRSKV
ncbi:LOW QUALITY PROTEIN: uncharacterized protein KIAA2013 homolog [Menidia menidia]